MKEKKRNHTLVQHYSGLIGSQVKRTLVFKKTISVMAGLIGVLLVKGLTLLDAVSLCSSRIDGKMSCTNTQKPH